MPAPDTPKRTVLVASDTPFVRDRFKTALGHAGLGALIVKSVAELLGRVRADLETIDLVVVDLKMPHARGAELVRAIRKLDENRLPILVFSGSVTSADEVKELAALGVSGYLNEYSAVEHVLPSIAPHLFPENHNRRDGPRVVMGIPVSYRTGRSIAAALSLNLSKGGIGIRTTTPLPLQTELALRFTLPGSKREIAARAIVRWSSAATGMGLRFTQVKPADQKTIDAFVDAHFFRPVKE
jgi:uncharacterized protein (TIGR02266 family)